MPESQYSISSIISVGQMNPSFVTWNSSTALNTVAALVSNDISYNTLNVSSVPDHHDHGRCGHVSGQLRRRELLQHDGVDSRHVYHSRPDVHAPSKHLRNVPVQPHRHPLLPSFTQHRDHRNRCGHHRIRGGLVRRFEHLRQRHCRRDPERHMDCATGRSTLVCHHLWSAYLGQPIRYVDSRHHGSDKLGHCSRRPPYPCRASTLNCSWVRTPSQLRLLCRFLQPQPPTDQAIRYLFGCCHGHRCCNTKHVAMGRITHIHYNHRNRCCNTEHQPVGCSGKPNAQQRSSGSEQRWRFGCSCIYGCADLHRW